MAEIILQFSEALLALPLMWLLFLIIGWRRRFKPFGPFLLRLVIIVLTVLALSQPIIPVNETGLIKIQERMVALVDESVSLTEVERQTLRAEAANLAQQFSNLEVLYFADQPVLLPFPERVGEPANLPLNPNLSNLTEALSMGRKLLNGQSGRLVILSDGLPTVGDDLEAVMDELIRQQIEVDALTVDSLRSGSENDIRLIDLTVPPILREGERFVVEVTLHSQFARQGTLELVQDATILAENAVDLEPGLNVFTFEAEATEIGPHTFQATVSAPEADDSQPANNSVATFTQVYPPPKILLVGDEPTAISRLRLELEEAGFVVDRIRSTALPNRLSELEPYAGMVMLDVSARLLELEQMLAVQEFVRSLGRGLVVTGGRNSYSLGDYEGTPLADLLPLSLEPPPREERPPVALLLIIDHSGSMTETQFPATKLAMAKEAAIRATDILGPDDLIGVLVFDNRFEWVVPFQPASDGAALLEIQSRIATVDGGGGTRILQALEVGLGDMIAQTTFNGPRHTVLFSDGKSFDGIRGREDYDLIVDAALESGITLSTIAIGDDADTQLLEQLAERGQGRYHLATEPDELPALTVSESDILRASAVQEGDYLPAIFAPHPVLRGLTANAASLQGGETTELPTLKGYIGLTPKPEAEIALQVGPGDPLLATWGYGLGRVVAWSSDVGPDWATDWYTWPDASRFWGQVVGYTLPAPNLGLLQLAARVEPDGVVTLTADGLTTTGQTVDLARTQATLITPGGREVPVTLRQISPGHYQQRLRLPDAGAYQLDVSQARTDAADETATIGFVVPYSAEYMLQNENTGSALLERLVTETGGRIFSIGQTLPPIVV